MSIKEVGNKSKPDLALPNEEEFDIVPLTGNSHNRAQLSHHTFTAVALILVASISFAIGKLVPSGPGSSVTIGGNEEIVAPKSPRAVEETGITANVSEVLQKGNTTTVDTAPQVEVKSGPIVASKNGTKYYSLTCSGAKRIKEENKVFFASEEDAKRAGLSPSSTCKDLK